MSAGLLDLCDDRFRLGLAGDMGSGIDKVSCRSAGIAIHPGGRAVSLRVRNRRCRSHIQIMKIYLAGVPGGGSPGICKREIDLVKADLFKRRLHSYYHILITKSKLSADLKRPSK